MQLRAPRFATSLKLVRAAAITSLIWLCVSFGVARAASGPYPVGVTFRSIPADTASRGDSSGKLSFVVFYPATPGTKMKPFPLGIPFQAPVVAQNGRLEPGRHSLIILSHGSGGSAMSMSWLALALAANGYIVAAPNHPGNTAVSKYTPQGFVFWWLRAGDLRTVLDAMLRDAEFRNAIDPTRIGAAGFSIGGYTTMEIAGGRTDWSRYSAYCATHTMSTMCTSPPEYPHLVQEVKPMVDDPAMKSQFAAAGRSYRDVRVRAVLAIAPAMEPAFVPQSLHAISIPVEIIAGIEDPIALPSENAIPFAAAIPGSTLQLLKHAAHYTFVDECTPEGKRAVPAICVDPPGIDRAAMHVFAAQKALQFFAKTLKMGPMAM